MSREFLLSVSTPERSFFQDAVTMIVLPAVDGEIGVMAGHEKMVSVLASGLIRIQKDGNWRAAATSEGYAMLYGDRAVVLVQSVEWAEEIDEERAMAALEAANTRIRTPGLSHRELVLSQWAQRRAQARLKLLERVRNRGKNTQEEE